MSNNMGKEDQKRGSGNFGAKLKGSVPSQVEAELSDESVPTEDFWMCGILRLGRSGKDKPLQRPTEAKAIRNMMPDTGSATLESFEKQCKSDRLAEEREKERIRIANKKRDPNHP